MPCDVRQSEDGAVTLVFAAPDPEDSVSAGEQVNLSNRITRTLPFSTQTWLRERERLSAFEKMWHSELEHALELKPAA